MNFMVMTFLYDQFQKLNEDFGKCINAGGEFSGNFEQFRIDVTRPSAAEFKKPIGFS